MANPGDPHADLHPQGTVVLSDSILPHSRTPRTAFYHDVLRSQTLDHAAMIGLSQKRDFGVGFCLNREAVQDPYRARAESCNG